MPRVKSNVARLKRKKKIMRAAKGARGARSKLYKSAKETVERGWRYAYRDRRQRKRDFRRLWIVRINAAARMAGLTYGQLIHGLKKGGISIDRKMLADLAMHDPDGFSAVADVAKSQLAA